MTQTHLPARLIVVSATAIVLGLGPALAATCPALLGAGIDVVYDDGGVSQYRPGPDGTLVETAIFPEGGSFREVTLHGVHVLSYQDVDESGFPLPGNDETIDYRGPLTDLPAPTAGLNWAQTVLSRLETNEPTVQRRTLTVGIEEMRTYGDCSYTVLPATVGVAVEGDGVSVLTYDYVPGAPIWCCGRPRSSVRNPRWCSWAARFPMRRWATPMARSRRSPSICGRCSGRWCRAMP